MNTPQEEYKEQTGENPIDSSSGHRHRTQEYAEWCEKRVQEYMEKEFYGEDDL